MDAPYSKELQRLLTQAFAQKKVIAAVGYGVGALLRASISDPKHPQAGMSILYGKQVQCGCNLHSCSCHSTGITIISFVFL